MKRTVLRILQATAGLSAMLCVVLSFAAMPSCNTVEGAGEDIRGAGDAINDAAEDAND